MNDFIQPTCMIDTLDYTNYRLPFFAFRPNSLKQSARFFIEHFKGQSLFAVKTNPEPLILKQLFSHGIRAYEAASLTEIALVREVLPEAEIYFMHPVKSRHAIKEAYFNFGVRHFVLDSLAELDKILTETGHAKDLSLHLRLAVSNIHARHSLADKFGAQAKPAKDLLKKMQKHAAEIGVSFHVGSQCMHPVAYKNTIADVGLLLKNTGVQVNMFNVGGGFPSIYPGMTPPPLIEYFDAIHQAFEQINQGRSMRLLCEPGRAMVAESVSLVTQVILRKGQSLYLDDGTYGALFDAGIPGFVFPLRRVGEKLSEPSVYQNFSFYGPTCDSLDFMKGPFYLPHDMQEGDFIEIGQIGAYGKTMATGFNGFSHEKNFRMVEDQPLMTLYTSRSDFQERCVSFDSLADTMDSDSSESEIVRLPENHLAVSVFDDKTELLKLDAA